MRGTLTYIFLLYAVVVVLPSRGLGQTTYDATTADSNPGAWSNGGTWAPGGVPGGNAGDSVTIGTAANPNTGVVLSNYNVGAVQDVLISHNTSSTGSLWIKNGGTLLVNNTLYTGSFVANSGFGNLYIEPGADLTVLTRFWTGVRCKGLVTQSGGTVNIDASDDGDSYIGWEADGTYTMSGGTLAITNDSEALVLGNKLGVTGTFNLQGGEISVRALEVGAGTACFNWTGGRLNVDTINMSITNAGGILNPARSGVGTVHIDADYVQESGGTLEIQIAGASSCDSLSVQNTATMAADTHIDVVLLGGYEPAIGATFDVMTASSFVGGSPESWIVDGYYRAALVGGGNGQILQLTYTGPYYRAKTGDGSPGVWSDQVTWDPSGVPGESTGETLFIGTADYPNTGVILSNHNAGALWDVLISHNTSSTGTLWIRSGGTLLVNNTLYTGSFVANSGFGNLYIEPGADLTVLKRFWTGVRCKGQVTQSGGTVNIDASDQGHTYVGWDADGTYTMSGGTLSITNDSESIVLGQVAGVSGTFNLQGGDVYLDTLQVGMGLGTFTWTGGRLNVDAVNMAVTNVGGILNPGRSGIGTADVNSSYVQETDGTLEIQIAGTSSSDYLDVRDTATMAAGTHIRIVLLDGFEPELHDTFNVMTASSFAGGSLGSWRIEDAWTAYLVGGGNGQVLQIRRSRGTVISIR